MFRNSTNIISPDEDLRMIREIKAGNKSAMKKIFDKHKTFTANIIYKVLWNQEDTADALQETFIKVWKNISSFEEGKTFTTWLYKIAVNCALDKLRQRAALVNITNYSYEPDIENKIETTMEDQIENYDLTELIKKLSNELSPVQKVIFTLLDLEHYTINEACTILNMSPDNVKSNICYARKSIRLKIAKYL